MRLLHYRSSPFVGPLTDGQDNVELLKPKGLWVSVEGDSDWVEFCIGADFMLKDLSHVHEVTLKESANILLLDTERKILEFSDRYRADDASSFLRMQRDWPKVQSEYDGIIIAPYQWRFRLDPDTSWYYSWDCASGCIWNAASAVETIKLVEVHNDA